MAQSIQSSRISPPSIRVGASIPLADLKLSALVKSFTPAIIRDVVDRLKIEGDISHFMASGVLRQRASDGSPGAFSQINGRNRKTIVIGDQHANSFVLESVLEKFGPELHARRVNLVFLGDWNHPERGDSKYLKNMKDSYKLFKSLVMLKYHFPDQVHLLQGNHDVVLPMVRDPKIAENIVNYVLKKGMDAEITKEYMVDLYRMGLGESILVGKIDDKEQYIPQGYEFLRYVIHKLKDEGKSAAEIARELMLYQELIDNCPLTAAVDGNNSSTFLAHVPIIRGGVKSINTLVDARLDSEISDQFLWNKKTEETQKRKYEDRDVMEMFSGLASILKRGIRDIFMIGGHAKGSQWVHSPIFKNMRYRINHANVKGSYGYTIISDGIPQEEPIVLSSWQSFKDSLTGT